MILRVKVKPNSRIDAIEKEPDGSFKVRIKEQPIEGKANKYLVSFLAKVIGVPKSNIEVAKGETSAFKTLHIAAEEVLVYEKLNKNIKTT
jgi:uncharacterized protein (TIGR00251 family)